VISSTPRARAWLLAGKPADPARLARDGALLIGGLFVFAIAQALSLQCNLGAASWTVLHDGLARQLPLSIGQATQLVGLLMGMVAWLAGVRPGLGTLANMLLIGLFLDLILWSDLIPEAGPYPARVAMLLAGIAVMGVGSALYIKAGFGAGPRDSFMLALMRHSGLRVGVVRWGMEVTAAVGGIVLGGSFGIGTLIFAMLVGLSVDIWFRVLRVSTSGTRDKG
jgi:uncharacterized membrane protein YczE